MKTIIIESSLPSGVTGTFSFSHEESLCDIKAAIVECVGAVDYDNWNNNLVYSYGITDGTNQRVSSISDRNGTASMLCKRYSGNDELIKFINPVDGSSNGVAEFNSFNSNGISINITEAFDAGYKIRITLFCGNDLQANVGTIIASETLDEDVSVDGVGFTPSLIYFQSTASNENSISVDSKFLLGISNGNVGSSINFFGNDGVFTSDNSCKMSNESIGSDIDSGGTLLLEAQLKSIDSDGFTITTTRTCAFCSSVKFYYLALSFNNETNIDVKAFPTETGIDSVNVGFEPGYINLLMFGHGSALNEADHTGLYGINIASINNESESTINITSKDFVGTAQTRSRYSNNPIENWYSDGVSNLVEILDFKTIGYDADYLNVRGTLYFIELTIEKDYTLEEDMVTFNDSVERLDEWDGDETLSDSFTYSSELQSVNQIQITVTGDSGDTDRVEVYQFKKVDDIETIGTLLGTITLNGDTPVSKTFNVSSSYRTIIGLKMIDGSSETPKFKGVYV